MRQDPLSPDASEADLAAFWFARMNGGHAPSPQDEALFHRWLDEGAANMQAYRDCLEAWRMLDMDAGEPEVLALRAAALRRDERLTTRRRALFGLTGGAVAAACGGLWVMTSPSSARALISTQAGQRLTAPLPDGSEVTLAPSSRLRLDYAGDRRGAVLETGQAYFDVRAGTAPFVLQVGDQVLATEQGRFQTTYRAERPETVVEQGRLRISDRRDGKPPVSLIAGQSAEGRTVVQADVEAETAWRLGRLVVRDRPLREVVERFNLYSSERLVLQDQAAGDVRISGSFRYDGGREFALALAQGFDLSVRRTADGVWRIGSPDRAATL
ncbi:FecR family protein [Brevundimonas faecalis]|uniref:Transmembrane sensor n=1 Tax=Brevundimonas faecalis TaxID=947378 RepID=A0ABV2RCW9_9CAUL